MLAFCVCECRWATPVVMWVPHCNTNAGNLSSTLTPGILVFHVYIKLILIFYFLLYFERAFQVILTSQQAYLTP